MTTKIKGTEGVEFPDSTVQGTQAYGVAAANAAFMDPAEVLALFTGANQSLTGSGYQKLPGGLIVQWGSNNTSAGSVSVTFPIAFPNAVFQVVAVCAVTANIVAVVGSQSTSGCTLFSHIGNTAAAASTPVRWIAIGY